MYKRTMRQERFRLRVVTRYHEEREGVKKDVRVLRVRRLQEAGGAKARG